jgi:hypothetical protein
MAGLEAGRYLLWPPALFGVDAAGGRIPGGAPPVSAHTGGRPVQAVYGVHHLEVRLQTDEGLLVPEVLLTCEGEGWRESRFLSSGIALIQVLPGPVRLAARTDKGLAGAREIRIGVETGLTETAITLTR